MRSEDQKPILSVVEEFSPDSFLPLFSLSDRIRKVINDYLEQEEERKRLVTKAEIVGILECIKNSFVNQ